MCKRTLKREGIDMKVVEVKPEERELQLKLIDFISSRKYATWKGLVAKQDSVKQWLNYKLQDEDGKRFEFDAYGLVCKYIRKEIRKVDHTGLAHELANYIQVEQLVDFGCFSFSPGEELPADLLATFTLPKTTYARFTLNKNGKVFNHTPIEAEPEHLPAFLELQHELSLFNAREHRITSLESSYRELLEAINKRGEPFKCEFGTLSIINNKPQYDTLKALDVLGEETFLNHVKVDLDIVKQLNRLGVVPNFVKNYVHVQDYRVDFVVQSIESERKLFHYLDKKVELFKQKIS